MDVKRAKVFFSGRSQAVRLPKEFRLQSETVLVRRAGNALVLEPLDEWPQGYVASFTGAPAGFARPEQGVIERRAPLK